MRLINLICFFIIFESVYCLNIKAIVDYRLKRLLKRLELNESMTKLYVQVNYRKTKIEYCFSDPINRYNFYNFTERDVGIYQDYCMKDGKEMTKKFTLGKFYVDFGIVCGRRRYNFNDFKMIVSMVCISLVGCMFGPKVSDYLRDCVDKNDKDKIDRDEGERRAKWTEDHYEQERLEIAKNYPDRDPLVLELI